ncbi:MAG: hypothetical protein HYW00_00425 [Candidatus Colwellbacteria bacterium]|nr:hypothetical protein [Candidatus Colwellbacteria bacterium]
MNRTLKQFAFGSTYLAILVLIAGGVYFLYLKPTPTCTDNRQNQKEAGIDCGGPCTPCELKELKLITEEVKFFPAGPNQITLVAEVRNPSPDFSAQFSYQFELGSSSFNQSSKLRGKSLIDAQTAKYIVIPALPIGREDIGSIDFNISEFTWQERPSLPDIQIRRETTIDGKRIVISGILQNGSPSNISAVNLQALLFDREDRILNASVTRLEGVPAFGEKEFSIFFPEVEGLIQNLDPEKTAIQWDLNE